jgi:hypothetical protein
MFPGRANNLGEGSVNVDSVEAASKQDESRVQQSTNSAFWITTPGENIGRRKQKL